MKSICPICGKSFACSAQKGVPCDSAYYPFCSERCRMIDLGAWLDGQYRIPTRENAETDYPDGE